MFRRKNGIFRNLTIFVFNSIHFDGLPRPMNCFKLFDYKTQFSDWVFSYPKKNFRFFLKKVAVNIFLYIFEMSNSY